MKKTLLFTIIIFLTACQNESVEWNPIIENTGFDYFYTEIDRCLKVIDKAGLKADKGDLDSLKSEMDQAKNKLLQLKDYYIPLTTIRQKIYDSERFLKLKKIKKAESLLNESKKLLEKINTETKNKVFDKVVLDLDSMIEEVILSLDDNSERNSYNKMKKLGLHINLMLSRGDLILSGIEFTE